MNNFRFKAMDSFASKGKDIEYDGIWNLQIFHNGAASVSIYGKR
jgi:hypothetical protein